MTLIDRDEIVKVAEHAFKEWNLAMAAADGEYEINRVFKMKELCRAVEAVAMAAPIIDAAPVVHGEWETTSYNPRMVRCSKCHCGDHIHLAEKDIFNFCPICGARMGI